MAAFLAIISSIVWGSSDFLGGTMSRRRHPIAVLGGSQPFGLLAALIAVVTVGKWEFLPTVVRNGSIAGLLGLFGLIAFYWALSIGRMGIVSPISSMGVLIPLGIGLLRGDQPTPIQYMGIVIAIVGVVLASGPELTGGASPLPVALASISAVCFGFGVYFMAIGGRINPGVTVVMMRITQVALLWTVALVLRSLGKLKLRDVPMLAAIGITDASANVLYTTAASIGLLSLVSVLGSLFPVVTVLLAWWVHKERLVPIQYVGLGATICGVIAISVG